MARLNLEEIKAESQQLRGTLPEEVVEPTPDFSEEARQLLKFHGIYQQDDRDERRERKQAGLEPSYQFMVRTKLTGGALSAEQFLAHDDLATRYGNGTLRITTRQGFQFHGVLKGDLQATLRALNEELVTTLGACGDIERNVMCCPAPTGDAVRTELLRVAHAISDHLAPRTTAYHTIWLDGERVDFGGGADEAEPDPIYGKNFLPRKFKTAVAFPGDNCVDVLTNDLSFVAVLDETGQQVEGYVVFVGGGMGQTHNKPETFPRLADAFAFVTPDEVVPVAEAIVVAYRDNGNRANRKQARLKYLIHERGLAWFKQEVEARLGHPLAPPRALPPFKTEDHLGWGQQADGRLWLGLPIENGRIADDGAQRLRSGLRALVERFRPNARLTPQHNILLTDIEPAQRRAVDALLLEYGIAPVQAISGVRRHEMACPALPTCGLALAESERVAPALISELEQALDSLGLADEEINLRMTGCPNGCARPYVAEIGIVGRSLNKYTLYLGGDFHGTRLNREYADLVEFDALVPTLAPLLALWGEQRQPEERFGAFCDRIGVERLRALAEQGALEPTAVAAD